MGDRSIAVDPEVTAAFWVALRPSWGCDCLYCRNLFVASEAYPPELRAFLHGVGLLPEWPSESMWIDEEPDRVWYLSLYHVRGRLLSAGPVEWDLGGFGVGVGDQVTAPCPAEFPEPILEISVQGWLPWVMAEPNEGGCVDGSCSGSDGGAGKRNRSLLDVGGAAVV